MRVAIGAVPWADMVHLRHWYEALLRSQDAEVWVERGDGAARDFTVCPQHGRPLTGATVYRWTDDPHGMVHDLEIEDLLDPEQVSVAERYHRVPSGHYRYLADTFWREHTRPHLPRIDGYDFFVPYYHDPLARMIGPRLQRARTFVVPWSVPEWIFDGDPAAPREWDVVWAGAVGVFYPLRWLVIPYLQRHAAELGIVFREESHRFVGADRLAAGWSSERFDAHQREYAGWLRSARAIVTDGSVFNYPLAKHFEAMACGTLVLSPLPRDAERLGLRDGENWVHVTAENWLERLLFYLANPEERVRIATNAKRLADQHYTCAAQARSFLRKLALLHGGARVDDLPEGTL